MGKITAASHNSFKSPKYIYAKIKREWTNYGAANLLDDSDFPTYTAEVLGQLGNTVLREQEALLIPVHGKVCLPSDFKQIYAAYKCKCTGRSTTAANSVSLQSRRVYYTDITHDTLSCTAPCEIDKQCDNTRLISSVTIRQYIDNSCVESNYTTYGLLSVSANVRAKCADDCLNFHPTCGGEITIDNGHIFANFADGDIFLQYYGFPFDEDGQIMIPDDVNVEKAIENYIKYQLLLSFWMTGQVTDIQTKWQKAEQLYETALAKARFESKLPSFGTLIASARRMRSINKTAFFAQSDWNRI
jgi:hypothetical protein